MMIFSRNCLSNKKQPTLPKIFRTTTALPDCCECELAGVIAVPRTSNKSARSAECRSRGRVSLHQSVSAEQQ